MSCATGVASIAAFVLALVLFQIYPAAPGHRSAFSSEVAGVLLVLSSVSFFLAPTALITGIKALRRLPADNARRDKITAWVGVTTGGIYTMILVIPMLVLALK